MMFPKMSGYTKVLMKLNTCLFDKGQWIARKI